MTIKAAAYDVSYDVAAAYDVSTSRYHHFWTIERINYVSP